MTLDLEEIIAVCWSNGQRSPSAHLVAPSAPCPHGVSKLTFQSRVRRNTGRKSMGREQGGSLLQTRSQSLDKSDTKGEENKSRGAARMDEPPLGGPGGLGLCRSPPLVMWGSVLRCLPPTLTL